MPLVDDGHQHKTHRVVLDASRPGYTHLRKYQPHLLVYIPGLDQILPILSPFNHKNTIKIIDLLKSMYLNIPRPWTAVFQKFRKSQPDPVWPSLNQGWVQYRTEYHLVVQKLPSTKYYKVVAALKYRILGSTKYSLTIFSRPRRSQGCSTNICLIHSLNDSVMVCENVFKVLPRPNGCRWCFQS